MRKRVLNVAGRMGMVFGRNTQRMPVRRSRCVSVHGIRLYAADAGQAEPVRGCAFAAVAEAEPARCGARRLCGVLDVLLGLLAVQRRPCVYCVLIYNFLFCS